MPSNFRYQKFGAVFGNLAGKIPVIDDVLPSQEQETQPNTSLDENSLDFEFQTDGNYYIDSRQTYMVLELNSVKGRG